MAKCRNPKCDNSTNNCQALARQLSGFCSVDCQLSYINEVTENRAKEKAEREAELKKAEDEKSEAIETKYDLPKKAKKNKE